MNCKPYDSLSGIVSDVFFFLFSVRDKKDLPLDSVDQKDPEGSFDYQ